MTVSSTALLVLTTSLGCLITYILLSLKAKKQSSMPDVLSKTKKTRVYVDGCWDVMHSGHYNALRQAKALGDILVVGVHSDTEIKHHKREPVLNNEQRMAAVSACKWADEVVFGVPYCVSAELLNDLKCDYVAHGDDIPIAANGHSAYHTVMDKLKIFRRTPGVSTTHLIARLLKAANSMQNTPETSELKSKNENQKNKNDNASWSSFLSSASRMRAFSNNKIPSKEDVVVYIDGDWDLFHIGHIAALKAAAKLGTFVCVGVYDDSTIESRMGSEFPLMNLQERVLNVLSCKYVDDVIIGCPFTITKQVLTVLNIAHVCVTPNTKFAEMEMDRYDIPKEMGIFREIAHTETDYKTADLIERIVNQKRQFEKENEIKIEKAKEYARNQRYFEETSA